MQTLLQTLETLQDEDDWQGIAALETEAQAAAETLGSERPNVAGAVYSALGLAYRRLGRHREAVEMHGKHLAIAQEVGDRAGEGRALNNMAWALLCDGQHVEAAEQASRAVTCYAVLERDLAGPDNEALRISIFAEQSKSYDILQRALLEGESGGAGPAMAVAGLSKARALSAAMAGNEGEGGGVLDEEAGEDEGAEEGAGGRADLAARQWAAVQRMAQAEGCAVVEYSVLNDGKSRVGAACIIRRPRCGEWPVLASHAPSCSARLSYPGRDMPASATSTDPPVCAAWYGGGQARWWCGWCPRRGSCSRGTEPPVTARPWGWVRRE